MLIININNNNNSHYFMVCKDTFHQGRHSKIRSSHGNVFLYWIDQMQPHVANSENGHQWIELQLQTDSLHPK